MPIYEYECRRCAHRFEIIQKFSDKPRKRCPVCSGAVDRLISPPAIRFKGTGWYVTDYADKKGGDGESKADREAKADSAADAAKADKPASDKKAKKREPKKTKTS